MKWLLVALLAAALGGYVYLQRHYVKITYVNGLPPYTTLPGTEYVVEKDCYLFKLKADNTDWPLIGAKDVVPGLPEVVSASNIGADLPDVRILDVIHVGDHFTITSVRRDESRTGTKFTFEVLLENEASRKYPRLDTYWIMDHTPEAKGQAPTILPEFAVPLRHT